MSSLEFTPKTYIPDYEKLQGAQTGHEYLAKLSLEACADIAEAVGRYYDVEERRIVGPMDDRQYHFSSEAMYGTVVLETIGDTNPMWNAPPAPSWQMSSPDFRERKRRAELFKMETTFSNTNSIEWNIHRMVSGKRVHVIRDIDPSDIRLVAQAEGDENYLRTVIGEGIMAALESPRSFVEGTFQLAAHSLLSPRAQRFGGLDIYGQMIQTRLQEVV